MIKRLIRVYSVCCSKLTHCVFISQLIRYARVCSRYNDFLYRGSILTSNLLKQGYAVEKLKTAFRKFYGRHSDLVGKYNISVSHMLQGLLDNNI